MKRISGWLLKGLAIAALAAITLELLIFAQVLWWSRYDPSSTSFMAIRLEELEEKNPDASLRHQWVPYEKISVHLKRAVVAAEDDRFLDHEGFDWDGIQKAIEKNQKKGHAVAGGSTISQQLAKNLFLSPSRSYLRKGQEAIITLMIEKTLDQAADPRGLSQCRGVGQRHLRRRGRRAPLLRHSRCQPGAGTGGEDGGHAAQSATLREAVRTAPGGTRGARAAPHDLFRSALRRALQLRQATAPA